MGLGDRVERERDTEIEKDCRMKVERTDGGGEAVLGARVADGVLCDTAHFALPSRHQGINTDVRDLLCVAWEASVISSIVCMFRRSVLRTVNMSVHVEQGKSFRADIDCQGIDDNVRIMHISLYYSW
jgi:hypothetical protein